MVHINHTDYPADPDRQSFHTSVELPQMYLDVAGVMFVVINKNKQVTLINPKGCDILGCPEAEVIGKNWFENFVPIADRAETERAFELLMAGKIEAVEYFQNPVLTRSGQERMIAWHNALIKDENGRPAATLSSGTDISDYMRAQEEVETYKIQLEALVEKRTAQLRASNQQLQAKIQEHRRTTEALLESQVRFAGILDIANEAIISVDESQKIMLFNAGAERLFGYSAREIIGRPLDVLLPERLAAIHQQHIAHFAQSPETARLMGDRQEIVGRRKDGREFPAAASISKLNVGEKTLFTVVMRDITAHKHIEQEREQWIIALRALNDSVRAITAELSLEQVLQKITHAARELVQVKYAALGLHDGAGHLVRFITAGIDPDEHAQIGPQPSGRGVLGHLLHHGESMIVNRISSHAASVGYPENHPPMDNLLGVPIFSKEKLIGALYLTDKRNGSHFTESDQQLVEMLAVHAAIAIDNAKLYEQTQRLAILEERERFARDLHDGIIQSIYAVGLALDQAKMDIRPDNYPAQAQIELSLESLASVIKDIRNYIFDLRPAALKYQGLKTRLDGLVKELRVNTLLPIHVDVAPNIDAHLTEMQARHIFHITHEALANAARHAKPTRISLRLLKQDGQIVVIVEDDGVGFDYHPRVAPGHHGLANMQTRAKQLNAQLEISSRPQQGTRLTLKFKFGSA